jgi:hypothetical protein
MAKFGERFLASVANPTYGQGLFKAAYGFGAAPRLREEQEKAEQFKLLGPVDQANFMLSEAKTPAQIAAAQSMKASAIKGQSQISVNNLELARQQALADPTKTRADAEKAAQDIEDIMQRVAVEGNLGSNALASISGRTASSIQARNEAEYVQKQRAAAEAKAVEDALVDNRAAMIAFSDKPINESVESLDLPDEIKARIITKATETRTRLDENQAAKDAQELSIYHTNHLKNNPYLMDSPSVKKALTILGAPTASPGAKRRAVSDIIEVIDQDFADKEKERNSKDRIELEANLALDHVAGLESPSEGVPGRDLIEVVNDKYGEGTEGREELIRGMTSLIIERPELRRPENVELLVSEGINLITRNKPPGLNISLEKGRQANKKAEQQRSDMREKAKQQLMSEGMSEKEAEARLVALEGQQTASRYMQYVP